MCFDEIVLWGNGDYLRNTIDKINPELNIVAIIDQNPKRQGEKVLYGSLELECCIWDENKFANVNRIIVATRNVEEIISVRKQINKKGIIVDHISTEIESYKLQWEEQQIKQYDNKILGKRISADDMIRCFVSITVPIERCNLQCSYCYVGQHKDFYKKKTILYSPDFIRRAFSIYRLGGKALINLCGTGETLLCKELVEIIKAFLQEGHYVSIITNALVEKPIQELLQDPNSERLFFKCSFHYAELKRKNLLNKYSHCVNLIIASRASCSIELVPHDELVNLKEEIKEYCISEFGALPHVTVTRDEEKVGYPIKTTFEMEEYKNVWRDFESSLFDIKMRHLTPEANYCIAGKGTLLIDLEHGGCRSCPNNMIMENIYKHIDQPILFQEIGHGCKNAYCINSHAYLTLGMIPEIHEITYFDVRNRESIDDKCWIKEPIKTIFQQRICDNLR